MIVSFFGYKVLHALERWACAFSSLRVLTASSRLVLSGIPVIFSFIMLCAFGGRHLGSANAFVNIPATAATVLSFASIVVGFSSKYRLSQLEHA